METAEFAAKMGLSPSSPVRHSLAILVVIAAASASVGHAQPTIPKDQIPAVLPEEVRKNIEGLYSADPQQRADAAMGWSGQSVAAMPFLIAMLHDDAVLYDDAELLRRSMISSRWRRFSYPNSPGQAAAEALAGLGATAGRPVVDALLVPLAEGKGAVRGNAARALGELLAHGPKERKGPLGAGRALESLIAALGDSLPRTREYAAVVLGQLEDPRAAEPLIALLWAEQSPETRQAVAAALGDIKDPRAVEVLIGMLEDPSGDVEVRASAAEALGKIGDLRVVEPIARALKDKDWQVRRAALSLADSLRDYRVLRPLVTDALQDGDWQVRDRATAAAASLGRLKDPAAFDLLLGALKDGHPNVRADAARSLAGLNDLRAVPLLIAALQGDDNGYVRWHAADALGELGDARAVVPLTAALEGDADEGVKAHARRALELIQKAAQSGQI